MASPKAILHRANEKGACAVRERRAISAEAYKRLAPELRQRAFTATGIDSMNTMREIQEITAKFMEGKSFREARSEIAEAFLEKHTPAEAARNAARIVRINAAQAYARARYEAQQETKDAFPYLMYRTMGDDNVRRDHDKLDGIILPADDPFWHTHYPPWEFGCRCVVVSITAEEAESMGAFKPGAEGENNKPGIMSDEQKKRFEERELHTGTGYRFNPSTLDIPLEEILRGRSEEERAVFIAQTEAEGNYLFGEARAKFAKWLGGAATTNPSEFAPAKNMRDAMAFAKNNIAADVDISGHASGLSGLNEINRNLSRLMEKYGIPKFWKMDDKLDADHIMGIEYPVKRDDVVYFSYSAEVLRDANAAFEKYVGTPLKNGKRPLLAIQNADEFIGHGVAHEVGHIMYDRQSDKQKILDVYKKAQDDADFTISVRATHNANEFYAEMFALNEHGHPLPDYIKDIFK